MFAYMCVIILDYLIFYFSATSTPREGQITNKFQLCTPEAASEWKLCKAARRSITCQISGQTVPKADVILCRGEVKMLTVQPWCTSTHA